MEFVAETAKWAWTLEDDQGEFVASMAIAPDPHTARRGWFLSFPGERIASGIELRAMFRLFIIFRDSGAVYDELRAWVASEDARAIRFAEFFGFVYDCGPATAFSPTGRDLSLYLWRR